MKTTICAIIGVLAMLIPLSTTAQVPNEGLANGIVAARKKDAAMLMQYNWNSRVEIQENGKVEDIRISLVNLGADGQPQRTLLNDSPAQFPGGFFRRAIAEKKAKEMEKYIKGLSKLLDDYTLPTEGKVLGLIVQAQVQPMTTAAGTVLQVTGNNVVVPGDTFTMTIDGKTLRPTSLQISTSLDGDAVTATASFQSLRAGLNHLQYASVLVPDKQIELMVHNFDYVPND